MSGLHRYIIKYIQEQAVKLCVFYKGIDLTRLLKIFSMSIENDNRITIQIHPWI
jgi:hypothetical protein